MGNPECWDCPKKIQTYWQRQACRELNIMKAAHWQDGEHDGAKHGDQRIMRCLEIALKTSTQNEPSTGTDLPIISNTHTQWKQTGSARIFVFLPWKNIPWSVVTVHTAHPQHGSFSHSHTNIFFTQDTLFSFQISLCYLTGFQTVKYFSDIVQDLQLVWGEIRPCCQLISKMVALL